jgi:NAD(P)-dependent dehydrogenase (short-subunit alcohol dehydrogenase family)
LARQGFGLTVTARDPARLDELAAELQELGAADIVVHAGDAADADLPAQLAAAHREAFGSMSALVLNAGVGTAGDIGSYPMSRFDKTMAVNVRAPFGLLQECLPLLRSGAEADPSRGARVIALASIAGVYAEAGLAAYGASKAAVVSLVEALNAEESGNGVTATAIAPGFVDTDMAAWVTDRIPAEAMIPVADIVTIVNGLLDLSARSVVPLMIVNRAGASGRSA